MSAQGCQLGEWIGRIWPTRLCNRGATTHFEAHRACPWTHLPVGMVPKLKDAAGRFWSHRRKSERGLRAERNGHFTSPVHISRRYRRWTVAPIFVGRADDFDPAGRWLEARRIHQGFGENEVTDDHIPQPAVVRKDNLDDNTDVIRRLSYEQRRGSWTGLGRWGRESRRAMIAPLGERNEPGQRATDRENALRLVLRGSLLRATGSSTAEIFCEDAGPWWRGHRWRIRC
jgi:hypothetical protein